MSILWYILLIVCFLGLLGLIIWLLIVIFKEREAREDNTLLINFLSKRGKGHFIGEIIKSDRGKNGRWCLQMLPKDLSIKHKEKIVPEPVLVDKNKLIQMPKGISFSNERNFAWALPANLNDIPEGIKDTDLGKAIVFLMGLKDLQKTIEDILREDSERKNELLKKIGNGEISKEFIKQQEGLVQDFLERVVSPKDSKSATPLFRGIQPPQY